MKVLQTRSFKNAVKKLHKTQKADLDHAIRTIINDPSIGDKKSGVLSAVRVYKFKMVGQLMLLAYNYENEVLTLTLLAISSHENLYRDLNQSIS